MQRQGAGRSLQRGLAGFSWQAGFRLFDLHAFTVERQRLRHVPEMEDNCQSFARQRGAHLGHIHIRIGNTLALIRYRLPRPCQGRAAVSPPGSHTLSVWSKALYLIGLSGAFDIISGKCQSRFGCDAGNVAGDRYRLFLGGHFKVGIRVRPVIPSYSDSCWEFRPAPPRAVNR